jgi:hypothetical protein
MTAGRGTTITERNISKHIRTNHNKSKKKATQQQFSVATSVHYTLRGNISRLIPVCVLKYSW